MAHLQWSCSEVTQIQVPTKTLLCLLHLQGQPAQPPPVGAAPAGHLGWSPVLCGTCPAPDSSTVQVSSIFQLPCFAPFLLLGVFAVLSENIKNYNIAPIHSGNEKHLTVVKNRRILNRHTQGFLGETQTQINHQAYVFFFPSKVYVNFLLLVMD